MAWTRAAWATASYDQMRVWWSEGLSSREIADLLEEREVYVSPEQVLSFITKTHRRDDFPRKTRDQHRAAQSRGMARRNAEQPPVRGKKRPRPLTAEWAARMSTAASMWRAGASAKTIAAKLGTSDRQIHNLACRNRHIFPKRYR